MTPDKKIEAQKLIFKKFKWTVLEPISYWTTDFLHEELGIYVDNIESKKDFYVRLVFAEEPFINEDNMWAEQGCQCVLGVEKHENIKWEESVEEF